MDRATRTQRGFTLVEVMAVVALLGVLAAIVVPTYFTTSRKAKAESEVSAIFAELAMREEQWKQEAGTYLTTAACPTTSTTAGSPAAGCLGAGSDWAKLRVIAPLQTLRCSYAITTGTGVGVTNPDGFTFTAPPMNWYYILATCNTDGVASVNSKYFASSVDPAIQSKDRGK